MSSPLVLLLVSVLVVPEVAPDGEVSVRKCCGQHQFLDASHVCRDPEAGDSQLSGGDPWWWLPRSSVRLNNSPTDAEAATWALSGVRAVYNAMAPCDQESRLELVSLPGEDVDEFHLHIGAQQVQLQVAVPEASPHTSLVPAASFCVDGVRVGNTTLHAALACACAGAAPCVRKCCHDYEAYDPASGGSCAFVAEEEGDRDHSSGLWRPALTDREASRSYFLLRNRKPSCTGGSRRLQGNVSDFRLREDGYLLVPGGEWLSPEEFCGDHALGDPSTTVVLACLRPAGGP